VGGIPNVFGPILGALLFTALPAVLQPLQEYRDVFQGAILVLVIVFLPRGLTTLLELRRTARLRTVGAQDVA
jgi:branched-chain amino acid transport system permease protein